MKTSDFAPTNDLHQICIVDHPEQVKNFPTIISNNIKALQACYPTAEYHLWNESTLRTFLSKNFQQEVVDAFELLQPYSYKADLARYCLLYIYGGLYVDLGLQFINPLKPPSGSGLAGFQDVTFLSPSWAATSTGIIWSKPERREFEIAIEYIVENCSTRYYGKNSLYPTGPVLFGRALIAALARNKQQDNADDQYIGVARTLGPGLKHGDISYIAPDNTLIALRNKEGDLSLSGVDGANNYNTFWNGNQVYGETTRIWNSQSLSIRVSELAIRTSTGIAPCPNATGLLTYGPYIDLKPGLYNFSILLSGINFLPGLLIEVVHDLGKKDIHSHKQQSREIEHENYIEFQFKISEPVRNAEFRIYCFDPFAFTIKEMSLEIV